MDMQSITSKPLVTVAEAMDFCEAGQTKFAQIASLVMVATRQIERECERVFAPQAQPINELLTARQTLSREYDWGGYGEVTMGGTGLVTVSKPQSHQLIGVNVDPASVQVFYDPQRVFGTDTAFDATQGDFFMEGDTLVIQRGTHYGVRCLKVAYSSGFPVITGTGQEPDHLGPVPDELKQACLFQVSFLRMHSKPDNIGMTGERSKSAKGTGNIIAPFSVIGGICPEAAALVEPYKRVLMGAS